MHINNRSKDCNDLHYRFLQSKRIINSCHVDKVFFFPFFSVANNRIMNVFISLCSILLFSVMSNPSRSQQRFPFRVPVRVQRNNCKLPPITQIALPQEHDDELTKSPISISTVDIRHETPPPPKLRPRTPASAPPSNADDFWVQLRQHIANETVKQPDAHGSQQTPNKVVRIFVSSTFTDFFNEREVLIKKVRIRFMMKYSLYIL